MDAQIVVGLLGLAGLVFSNFLIHKRWAREQDEKRTAALDKAAADRRRENIDRDERQSAQVKQIVNDALLLVEVHKEDARTAALDKAAAVAAHTECRQEVAHLGGQVAELRSLVEENKRNSDREARVSERHQDIKHMAMTALTVSEGITGLVVKQAAKALQRAESAACDCGALQMLEPIAELVEGYHPRLDEVVEENKRQFDPNEEKTP